MYARQEDTERSDTAPAPYARVVIAERGLVEHGTPGCAPASRDEGCDVTRADLNQAPAHIVAVVITQDVPSTQPAGPSGAHLPMVDAMIERLEREEAGGGRVLVGGIVPAAGGLALDNVKLDVASHSHSDSGRVVEGERRLTVPVDMVLEWAC